MPENQAMPFRVLIAADTYPPHVNGAAQSCFRLATELTARGYDVHVVAPRDTPGPDTVEYQPEATIHRLRSYAAPTHEFYRLVMPWHANRTIDDLIVQVDQEVIRRRFAEPGDRVVIVGANPHRSARPAVFLEVHTIAG